MSGPFDVGSGAVSLGRMIVIHEAPDLDSARRAAAWLEQARIPALIQNPRAGLPNIPTPRPSSDEAVFVAVPSTMRAASIEILRAHELSWFGAAGEGRRRLPRLDWRARPSPEDFLVEAPEDGPIDPDLPDAGPVAPRLAIALGAIAFGALAQLLLGRLGGEDVARAMAGASRLHLDELWRLVTAGFFHFSISHHLSNAALGTLLGVVLFGSHRVGAVAGTWLFASVIGVGAEILVGPVGALVAGASAGNYGLVGLWAMGQRERAQRTVLPRRERLRTLGVLLLLVPGALTPVTSSGSRVAVFAHVAGFVAGCLAGLWFHRRLIGVDGERIERRARQAGLVSAALVGVSFTLLLRALLALG